MNRFKRIAHRGWLGRFLSIATFGYFPRIDGGVAYIVQADVECRFVAVADAAARATASGDSAIRWTTGVVDVEL